MWRICNDERERLWESTFPNKAATEPLADMRARMYIKCFMGRERASTANTGDELTADDLQPHDQRATEHVPEQSERKHTGRKRSNEPRVAK